MTTGGRNGSRQWASGPSGLAACGLACLALFALVCERSSAQPAEVRQVAPGVSEVVKGGTAPAAGLPGAPPEARLLPPPAEVPRAPAAGQSASRLVGVSTLTGLGETGLRLQLDRPAKVNAFTIPQPPRLVIDLDAVEVPDAALVGFAPPAWVADYRYGQIVGGRFRLLFDLAVPVRLVRLAPDGNDPKVLRIDLSPVRSNETPATVAVSLSYDPAQEPTPTAPSQKRPRGKPVVVIDPGHGGIDPGAVAASGILEKDIALAVAQEVRRSLSALGRYDVRMTRDTDQLVRLGDRVRFAETAGAELFISIHADTFVGQPGAGAVRGGSVYVLGEDVSRSAAEFAAKENAADAVAGVVETAAVVDKQVAPILADLVARETADLSLRAQGLLIRDLRRAMTLAREPARAAGFRVLRQADVPSVLIELGYMSNAADTAQLQSAEWQRSVAAAITRAIDGYFSTTASSRGRSATP